MIINRNTARQSCHVTSKYPLRYIAHDNNELPGANSVWCHFVFCTARDGEILVYHKVKAVAPSRYTCSHVVTGYILGSEGSKVASVEGAIPIIILVAWGAGYSHDLPVKF